MTDEELINLVDKIAAASGYGGLDSSTMYGEFALDVAKAVREECAKLSHSFANRALNDARSEHWSDEFELLASNILGHNMK